MSMHCSRGIDIETIKAALAEVGQPIDSIVVEFDGTCWYNDVPVEVMWRAVCTSQPEHRCCLTCFLEWTDRGDPRGECFCEATVHFMQDCGRMR